VFGYPRRGAMLLGYRLKRFGSRAVASPIRKFTLLLRRRSSSSGVWRSLPIEKALVQRQSTAGAIQQCGRALPHFRDAIRLEISPITVVENILKTPRILTPRIARPWPC
jgi:hypothetical protein